MRGIRGKRSTSRKPRKTKLTSGETFNMVEERPGQFMPRCIACGKLVPVKVWWEHSCQTAD